MGPKPRWLLVAALIAPLLILGMFHQGPMSSGPNPRISVVHSDSPSFIREDSGDTASLPSAPEKPPAPSLFTIVSESPESRRMAQEGSAETMDPSIPVRRVYRSMSIRIPPMREILRSTPGQIVSVPLFDGQTALVKVVLVRPATEQDPAAISGAVQSPFEGSFALVDDPRLGWRGSLVPKNGELAYEIETIEGGGVSLDEVPKGDVVCSPYPKHPSFQAAARLTSSAGLGRAAGAVPALRSRANAKGVLYLDFDGAVVTDPFWANGATINALPSGLSNAQITNVWRMIAEDFLPFDVNVTTVERDYANAKIGLRMRCIFTPTVDAAPGAGGVAYLGSFKWSGTTPCWTFNGTGTGAATATAAHLASMTGSHELGHTFNLRHDGDNSQSGQDKEYYRGHGTGLTSWGPIMGAPFTASVIQWSKGEYQNASNPEDDVAIISGNYFGVGYVGDDYADSGRQASIIPQSSKGVVAVSGLISSASDKDVFRMECGKGTVTINAAVAISGPNLDVKIELLNGAGAVLQSSDLAGVQTATLSASVATQGTYFLRVSSGAEPDGLATGWTTYGSIGAYTLSGTFPSTIGYSDNFSEASPVPSTTSFSLNASSSFASREPKEPSHAGQPATKSLWWKYVAIGNGRLRITTKGSGFDTVLAVYTGSSLAGLIPVAANDNAVAGVNYSQVDFTTSRGTTYYLVVDGKNRASGNIKLTGSGTILAGPANDNFTSPTPVSGTAWKISGSNFNATLEDGEPSHGDPRGYASVWFRWNPPVSGTYTLSTIGSGLDTLLGVYTGADVARLTLVGANNNSKSGVSWSRLRFSAAAGIPYYIAVDGVNRSTGRFSLQLSK